MQIGAPTNDPGRPPVRSYAKPFGDDRLLLAPVCISWHDDDPATPVAELIFDIVDGRLACTGVTVRPSQADGVVTAAALRKLDLNAAQEVVAQTFSMPASTDGSGGMRARLADLAAYDDSASTRASVNRALNRTAGRKDRPFLTEVAAVYEANPQAPTQAVAEHFSVAHRTAGLYVQRAREMDLLPPAPVRAKRGK